MSSHTHVLVYLSDVLHFSFVQRGRRLTLREMAFCQTLAIEMTTLRANVPFTNLFRHSTSINGLKVEQKCFFTE